jgi:hypothetical protein
MISERGTPSDKKKRKKENHSRRKARGTLE